MRRSFSALSLLAFSVLVVSSLSAKVVVVDDDTGFSKFIKAELAPTFVIKNVDLVAVCDAVVPVVQSYPVSHIASIVHVDKGHSRQTPAMIRGPTTNKPWLNLRSRDKPTS